MSLTRCPHCGRHCFTDAATCPSCALTFLPGELLAESSAQEKAFRWKSNAVFIAAFLIMLLGFLFFVQLQSLH